MAIAPPQAPQAPIERPTTRAPRGGPGPERSRLTPDEVWRAIASESFAVLSYVTPAGEPRSSGIVYGTSGRRLYVVVAPDSWKARHLVSGQRVSMTVLVRRGGILTLLFPIPPATISFQSKVIVHPAGSLDLAATSPELVKLLPDPRHASGCALELLPEGQFVTYGLGIPLGDMRKPALAHARVPMA
jgi:hypothetical protein